MGTMKNVLDKNIILKWCNDNIHGMYNSDINFEITDDGINITGNCYINNKDLTELPYKINIVHGNFICAGHNAYNSSDMHLTTLKNMPNIVYGNFDISFNTDLQSLEYSPLIVTGNFKCNHCALLNMNGISKEINGHIIAYSNPLTNINEVIKVKNFIYIDIDFCNEIKLTPIYKKLCHTNKIFKNVLL